MRDNSTQDGANLQYLQQSIALNSSLAARALLLGDPHSELTEIASASRKRCRDNSMPLQCLQPTVAAESTATSTSGRAFCPPSTPLAQDVVAHLYHQNLEMDALVRIYAEKLRLGLQEARKRQCRALLSAVEQQAAKRLREKEIELQNVCRRNADLEEKIRQVAGEKEVWMTIAKNNEAVVTGLRSAVEQLLLQNAAAVDGDGAPVFSADDAESCCYEPAAGGGDRLEEVFCRRACRACGGGDVSVLVLPCRHLCLCTGCESKVDTCPVCRSAKNASLQVFMA